MSHFCDTQKKPQPNQKQKQNTKKKTNKNKPNKPQNKTKTIVRQFVSLKYISDFINNV